MLPVTRARPERVERKRDRMKGVSCCACSEWLELLGTQRSAPDLAALMVRKLHGGKVPIKIKQR